MNSSNRGTIALFLVISVVLISFCGWLTIKPILGTCIASWPESLQDPPVMPGAQNIEYGKSSYDPPKGKIGELTQFQSDVTPVDVYAFYLANLGKDGWSEDRNQHVMASLGLAEAKFDWECTTMSSRAQIASLWLHAEVIPSGKTVVTLNYDYVPR